MPLTGLSLTPEQARRDVATLNEQLRAAQASLAEQQAALAVLRGELEQVTAQYNEIKKTQAAERERLAQFDEEVHSLERHIKARYAARSSGRRARVGPEVLISVGYPCSRLVHGRQDGRAGGVRDRGQEALARRRPVPQGAAGDRRAAAGPREAQRLDPEPAAVRTERAIVRLHRGIRSRLCHRPSSVAARPRTRLFGQPGSQFDFAAQDPAQAAKRLEQLQEASQRLSKNVNRKVNTMLERYGQWASAPGGCPSLDAHWGSSHSLAWAWARSVEKEEKALKEKLATVLNDKYKIEDTIKTLDQKKQEALRKTWEKVNG